MINMIKTTCLLLKSIYINIYYKFKKKLEIKKYKLIYKVIINFVKLEYFF